jgi:uncharacterized protein YbjQ (UPF0145 family)
MLRAHDRWGGFSSFLSAPEFVVAESVGLDPVGQVVGIAAGFVRPGYVRWADRWGRAVVPGASGGSAPPGSGLESARWQRHPQIVLGWNALRRRALARLTDQAERLGCQAVIGIQAHRDTKPAEGEGADAVIRFTGTAVRIDQWRRRKAPPVLVLGTMTEVAVMLRYGIEPLGIVGGVGRIELRPSETTMRATRRTGYSAPNAELEDVTHSIYEARRGAMVAVHAEAAKLHATGVLAVTLEVDQHGTTTRSLPGVGFTAHALGVAVRRTAPPTRRLARPVLDLGARPDG